MDYFSDATSTIYNIVQPAPGNWSGKGTNVVKVPAYVNPGLLKAETRPINRKQEEEDNGQVFAPGVQGWRYFFPTLFKIELEPNEGKAVVKHLRTDNTSLNGVDGFKDYEMKLELNKTYSIKPSPDSANYKYKYYKKRSDADPSNENPFYGDPMTFTYEGKFQVYYLNLYYEGSGGSGNPTDPPPGGQCTSPAPSGNVIDVPLNDPAVSAVIKADSRGAERFNVLDGIPTSESLYGNVLAKSYLSKNKFVEMSGTCSFEITVNRTYELTWDPGKEVTDENGNKHTEPDPQSASETLTKSYPIERKYSFWVIDNLEVYKINEAALQNYAFEGNGIRLSPSGYSPPSYAASKSSGYTPPSPPNTVEAPSGSKSGGKTKPDVSGENLKSYAEDAVDEVKVKNDSLTFNGSTIMNGAQTERAGQRPGQIPIAAPISNNVLYSPGHVIPTSKTNKADQPSTGTIYYGLMSGNINGGSDRSFPIYGINRITVHTPVVIYPGVSDDRAHNQKTTPAAGRSAIILDRPFTVMMPNNGQHTNYLGYGNRDYLKYIGSKQVRFPFDVYEGTKAAFYPKNTWIEVDKSREQFAFFLPVWVDEGFYTVEFRTIAHNAPSGATEQTNANLNLSHHIAYGTVPVDVIGRVYDFQVTDIADYYWEGVFRTAAGSRTPTGAAYWVGLNEIDGTPRGNISRFTLPIRPGSHPLYKNAVIKTGYHFKFDLKTKGNMFGPLDQIVITPTFDFIDATSGSRQPVDLYYHTGSRSYVRIGSASDQVQRYVILNERLRNVPIEEMTDTALYQYDHDYNFNQVAGIGRSQFVDWFIQKHSQQKTPIGSFSQLRLPEGVRTLIGPKTGIPSGVDSARANAAVQRWYGEYSLPAELYAVPAGTNVAEYGRTHGGLTDRSAIFLKKGYIVVNFNIETVRNGETGKPHLQYIRAPLMNQWTGMEGFARSVIDPYGRRFTLKDGDVAFYHADLSSRDDFRPLVTH
ncbi:DUF5704 domain-containing protein [Paenibacillus rubinfantis]|uniref:DUF5704 domain-containing protein n=1 Tax=Paenibacillus rubinfantis TaxID=1720296 RepID=UPI001CA3459E|nr:DUF5704 domain-containing protein [Paenibacillus rubinfantis]